MQAHTTTEHIEASLTGASPQTVAIVASLPNSGEAVVLRVRAVGREAGTPTNVFIFATEAPAASDGVSVTLGSGTALQAQSGAGVSSPALNTSGTDVVFEAGYSGGTTMDWTIDVEVARHV